MRIVPITSMFASIVAYVGAVNCARADFFQDLGRVVTAPVTAPIDATKRVLQGDDPVAAVTGPFQSAGRVIQQSSDAFQRANDVFMSVPKDAIRTNLGDDWGHAYDILTASQRVQFELASTSGRYLGKCLQGQPCGLNELAAGPLAAAMRDAYKAYIGYSAPLDPRITQVLARVVPFPVLQAARITVGSTPDFTVPGFLNAGHAAFGQGHAVTLGNLVIFSRPPNFMQRSDWNWTLHEFRHVEQYMGYSSDVLESIDGFAVDYMQNYNGIEADAQNTANSRQVTLDQMCQFGC